MAGTIRSRVAEARQAGEPDALYAACFQFWKNHMQYVILGEIMYNMAIFSLPSATHSALLHNTVHGVTKTNASIGKYYFNILIIIEKK